MNEFKKVREEIVEWCRVKANEYPAIASVAVLLLLLVAAMPLVLTAILALYAVFFAFEVVGGISDGLPILRENIRNGRWV